ncbi:hypothetical protein HUJ04_001201 [Dendroctonus ponderosae]|nr:hypothetical protein HUJ04_001201 [Dendroctonus ponderosae]KAH1011933.1 hypothetical protein HUJ04_001201 [Dendroctonus ponderosae]
MAAASSATNSKQQIDITYSHLLIGLESQEIVFEYTGSGEVVMFGPLTFPQAQGQNTETKCFLCEDSFNLRLRLDIFVLHTFDVHQCVIDDVQNIKNLPQYVLYWRNRFKERPIEQIIPTVRNEGAQQHYFFLSTLLKEDKLLRHRLTLDYVLKVQEFERTDLNYKRSCLFCKYQHEGSRQEYLEHIFKEHNLHLGNHYNLVFIDELIEHVDSQLQALRCLFCKGVFPERAVLKEHMRKKMHKQISPEDVEYDKFYIINYLEVDKSWRVLQHETDNYALEVDYEENCDQEYSDWTEASGQITCLYCAHCETDMGAIFDHIKTQHNFDFARATKELDFYQKIKLINYTRRMIYRKTCPYCTEELGDSAKLQAHLAQEGHCKVPSDQVFDQAEYYFSTYENDTFLYLIDDIDD